MAKKDLAKAKVDRVDEFFTRYIDIENEINAYLEFDKDAFRGKSLLLPCDDPEWSNFTKFFANNFDRLGLRKLVSTSYAPDAKSLRLVSEPTLFELEDPKFDPEKAEVRGKIFVLDQDTNGDSRIDLDDLQWDYLEGDGDFQSAEVTALKREADLVVTNPPFSLFRSFINWIFEDQKQFLLIGNLNAITYKEVYPRIQQNKMWLGVTNFNKGMYFYVPGEFEYSKSYNFDREIDGRKVNRVPSICWFTNLEHGRRHSRLDLITMEENLRFKPSAKLKARGYAVYKNMDAIDVPEYKSIPSDYPGIMGVPITFLDKYSPEQFEIVGFRHGSDGKDLQLEDGSYPFFRILIRHRMD